MIEEPTTEISIPLEPVQDWYVLWQRLQKIQASAGKAMDEYKPLLINKGTRIDTPSRGRMIGHLKRVAAMATATMKDLSGKNQR